MGMNIPQVTGMPVFSSKVKGQGHQMSLVLESNLASCLLMGGGSGAGVSGTDYKLGLTIVRTDLLSAPERETVGNWMDGRISCRHSALMSLLLTDCSDVVAFVKCSTKDARLTILCLHWISDRV